jgi:hypothetical protein
MIGWGKRLAAARLKIGHDNKTTFPLKVGSNRVSWAKFEDEEVAPNFEIMMRVKALTGVSLDWIASGEGAVNSAGLDRSALETALRTTFKIVESARRQNKTYPQDEIVSFVRDIYEEIINEPLDETETSTDSERIARTDGGQNAKNRKANS